MPHKIYISEDSSYIILEVEGEVTRANAMEFNIEAHGLGRKVGINKYLVNMINARNVDSTINNYLFTYNDMKEASEIDLTAVVAAVVSPEDHSHDFIETLAKNSGLNLTLFRSLDEALEYLKGKK
jgi:hypothetical protein